MPTLLSESGCLLIPSTEKLNQGLQSLLLVLFLSAAFPTVCAAQSNPAGAVFGAFGNIMNQAIQQQQQQQRLQQQLYLRQQQDQQRQLRQQQQYEQQQRYQQQQEIDLERRREAARQYREEQRHAAEKAAAERQQRDAAIAAAREKARVEAEAKAKAAQEAEAAAEEETQKRMAIAKEEARQKLRDLVTTLTVDQIFGPQAEDITVLVAAHDTSHVMRGLTGDPTFYRDAIICFPFGVPSLDPSTPDGRFMLSSLDKIRKKGNGNVIAGDCTSGTFGSFDLLVFSRQQIETTNLPPERVKPFVTAVTEGAFVKFGIYTHSAFIEETDVRRQKIEEDEQQRVRERNVAKEDFRVRDDEDISAIYTKSPALAVCLMGVADAGLTTVLASGDSPYLDVVPKTAAVRNTTTAPATFLALKTHDCLAAVGPTKMLREVIAGLERDGILFEYHSKSVPVSQMSKWKVRASALTGR